MADRPAERDELDALLNSLLPMAQEFLRTRGEFYPFGAALGSDGQVSLQQGYDGNEQPDSQGLIDLLTAGQRADAAAGRIRAAGICYDVRMRGQDGRPTDAVAVSLEHRDGDTVMVVLPYSKGRFSGLKFGDLISSPNQPRVFSGL